MSRDTKLVDSIQSRRNDIMEEINQTYRNCEQQNSQTGNDVERNILLLGSARCGKTTVRHMLIDPRHVADELTLRTFLSEEPICHRSVCPMETHLDLTIVELPASMIMRDNNLWNINDQCDRIGVNQFHLICCCTSIVNGMNGEDVESFQRLIDHFGKEVVCNNLCLIVTGCESKDEEQRNQLCKEIKTDFHFNSIANCFGQGIHFSGALNRDDWNRAKDQLYNQFITVYEYRMDLLSLIKSDLKPFWLQPKQSKLERPSLPTQER
jgi:hypothetical protein